MLSEYKEVFLEELEEQLQLMDDCIMELEQEGGRAETVQNLFRAAHTLKGSSAAMGFEEMKRLTHQMEHLLDQVRSGERSVTEEMVDLLFKALDRLKLMKRDIEGQDHCSVSIHEILQELQVFSAREADAGKEADGEEAMTPYDPWFTDSDGDDGDHDYENRSSQQPLDGGAQFPSSIDIQEALDSGLKVYRLKLGISPACMIQGARAYVIRTLLSDWGKVLEMEPDPELLDKENVRDLTLSFTFAGSKTEEELRTGMENMVDVTSVVIEQVKRNEQNNGTPIRPVEAAEKNQQQQSNEASEVNRRKDSAAADKAKTATVRVSVERLDHLMNLVGELVIDQTRVHQIERRQRGRIRDESVSDLGHVADHLSRIISDLQDSVMKARMLPIEQLFNRFPRMVRDLSKHLGKEIDLILEGKDTELDRTLIEEIADPLIHLIRNAVDHGLEPPERRVQVGKPIKGRITIKAAHEDNQVLICVIDDGPGIDPEKVKASAIRKGLISHEEADVMTEKDAVDLIFRPGFSTAEQVSDVSGRGVGMDIVRSHIEKLNGLIDIQTSLGEGTVFKIRLPLTLAIISGLLVKTAGHQLIVPMNNIIEIIRVSGREVENIRGRPVLVFRDQVIPVVGITGLPVPAFQQANKPVPIVIVGYAEKRMALVVDELIGNQEIVVKSLGSYVGKVEGIAGATILGDGGVALILEISALFNSAERFRFQNHQ